MSDKKHPSNWKYQSPSSPGFHEVVSPENSALKLTRIYRLNLLKGQSWILESGRLEYSAVVISGKLKLNYRESAAGLSSRGSFYLPSGNGVQLIALEDLFLFIGAAPCRGVRQFFTRNFDPGIPEGHIRQVHGRKPYRRDVFMTLAQQDRASTMICGITEGDPGAWTSWPPHQHSKDLEEVYCYFNIPAPGFALHLCSREAGKVEFIHPVSSGDCVIIPEGYHPTAGMPGVRSCYFWVMSAFRPESRRYDLAVDDPNFAKLDLSNKNT